MSQTGATVDYDQFFSGLAWDADSQLYYARARWYDPTIGKFLAEDPISFAGGDTNLSRYSLNDPVNRVDRNGLFSFKDVTNFVKDSFDIEKQFDRFSNNLEKVGNFFEKHWENGNIQKTLLVAGTIASGGVLGIGLAAGTLTGMALVGASLQFVSAAVNSYEVFSGDTIGNGSFSRYLSATAAVTGGFYGNVGPGFGPNGASWARGFSAASGLASGYEIASGNMIGDGTLSSVLHVGNLGVNHAGVFKDPNASLNQRLTVGINLAAGAASVASSGDPKLQQSLRSLSIAAGVWNTGTQVLAATQSVRMAATALKPTPPVAKRSSGVVQQVSYQSDTLEPLPPSKIGGLYELSPPLKGESMDQWLAAQGYQLKGSRKEAWQQFMFAKAGITAEDISGYRDFSPKNQAVMQNVYGYYTDLFIANPDLLWAGMAKLAGNSVWNGLQMGDEFKRVAPGYGQTKLIDTMQQELVRMNLEILMDLGWVHEAYVTGGIDELERAYGGKLLRESVYSAFKDIHEGKLGGDQNRINKGNAALLEREQKVILERGYLELARLQDIGLAQGMAKNSNSPIPGGKHFLDVVPGGDLTNFDDRWRWIETDMLPKWLAFSPQMRATMVQKPLGTSPNALRDAPITDFSSLFFHPPVGDTRTDEEKIKGALNGGPIRSNEKRHLDELRDFLKGAHP